MCIYEIFQYNLNPCLPAEKYFDQESPPSLLCDLQHHLPRAQRNSFVTTRHKPPVSLVACKELLSSHYCSSNNNCQEFAFLLILKLGISKQTLQGTN